MFILKFSKFFDGGSALSSNHLSNMNVVSCPSYAIEEYKNRTEIITYNGMFNDEGIVRTLMSDEQFSKIDSDHPGAPVRHWSVCYVENTNGKTIDTIRPAK